MCMVSGMWFPVSTGFQYALCFLVCGLQYAVSGRLYNIWYVIFGLRSLVRGPRNVVSGIHAAPGMRSMICDLQYVVSDVRSSSVCGPLLCVIVPGVQSALVCGLLWCSVPSCMCFSRCAVPCGVRSFSLRCAVPSGVWSPQLYSLWYVAPSKFDPICYLVPISSSPYHPYFSVLSSTLWFLPLCLFLPLPLSLSLFPISSILLYTSLPFPFLSPSIHYFFLPSSPLTSSLSSSLLPTPFFSSLLPLPLSLFSSLSRFSPPSFPPSPFFFPSLNSFLPFPSSPFLPPHFPPYLW